VSEHRRAVHPTIPGAGERIFLALLTVDRLRTTCFSGGVVGPTSWRRSRAQALGW
jgi:hypothetical protein